MEQESMDPQVVLARISEMTKDIRRSEAYPALIGGIAGGIAGGLMAALIAGRVASSRSVVADAVDNLKQEASGGNGWSMREAVQLAAVIAGLVKQVQAMYQDRRRV